LLLLMLSLCVSAQNKNKIDKLKFCGWQLNDKQEISSNFKEQFDFLNVQEGDTIVDIGAQSGTYEGCFLAVNNFKTVRFLLVDIDSSCLNQEKVHNMIAHYSKVKGDSIRNSFQIVQNTPDSLWLPLNQYRKVWLFNTLHELPDQPKMIKDIHAILKTGGEITILEIPAKYEGQLHGGCHKPLLSLEKINALFASNGFRFSDKKLVAQKKHFDVFMARYIKE
jgi:ubiquinone/menaquinone biosynthesis C-methylase UbiE